MSVFAASIMIPACALDPERIGATLTAADEGESDPATTTTMSMGTSEATNGDVSVGTTSEATGGDATTETATDSDSDSDSAAYGEPCTISDDVSGYSIGAIASNSACEGGICLFARGSELLACETDAECLAEPPYVSCSGEGYCLLDPAFVEERSLCTDTCESAADCPDMPGCETEVACLPMGSLEPFCCENVCACLDQIEPPQAEWIVTQCELAGACA